MAHTDVKFPARKRSLRTENLKDFIASYTGLARYASPNLHAEAIITVIEFIVESKGDDRDGYTYAHQFLSGPRLRRFAVVRFPLEARPDRLSVKTGKRETVEDTGWFGVEPENDTTWLKVLKTILIEIAKTLLSPEEIHLRLGGPVQEKPVGQPPPP